MPVYYVLRNRRRDITGELITSHSLYVLHLRRRNTQFRPQLRRQNHFTIANVSLVRDRVLRTIIPCSHCTVNTDLHALTARSQQVGHASAGHA